MTYDNLNRLTEFDRGTLSGGSITSLQRNAAWDLTATGNWSGYQVDADADGDSSYAAACLQSLAPSTTLPHH